VDAVLYTRSLVEQRNSSPEILRSLGLPEGRMILVTGHRRENFDGGLNDLAHALVELAQKFPDVVVLYSLHPNPRVAQAVQEVLGSHPRIRIVPPPDYFQFVALMKESFLIITDSGGIQEEAPSLKKPVLIARNVTERPEAVEAGAALLVGTSKERIVREASRLLEDPLHYASMTLKENPFGDGRAARRIVDSVDRYLLTRSMG
jgi:UDP-N-acetylglucosamine 2-epimerase (non-hydrolysing)